MASGDPLLPVDGPRRSFLAGAGALLAAACLPAVGPASAAAGPRRWIDVHHHFAPPGYREFHSGLSNPDGTPAVVPPLNWDLARDLEDMDRAGTRTALLSMFVPPQLGTPDSRARLARSINEGAARLRADHPGRFGSLASLPLPDIDTSLAEIAYAADTLKAEGFAVYTNTGDRWLGDRLFDPVYEELDRRKAVVFVHPTTANCCHALMPQVPEPLVEYGTDTTRAIASLVFGGTTTRFPGIRFIFSHGGGTMPFLIERFLGNDHVEIVPGVRSGGQTGPWAAQPPPGGVLAHLRRMHYDTAQCANPVAMQALKTLVGVPQVLFGTDVYYRGSLETASALAGCKVFSARELEAVGRGNALALWPALAAGA